MSNRLKYILGKEVIKTANKLPSNVARSINVVRSKEKEFSLNIGKNSFLEQDFKIIYKSLDENKFVQLSSLPNDEIQVELERDYYVKNVLEEIIHNTILLEKEPKKIVIDYSSPNIAKPFHMGHLRSTIIGNFIANINQHFDNKVVKINYLGDWGTQFGLLKIGLREKNISTKELRKDPMNILYDCYVHANALASVNESVIEEARKYFSEVEKGVSDIEEWKTIKEITVQELTNTYKRLGVNFDFYNWESDYNAKSIEGIFKLLGDKNITRTDELGRKVANVQNKNVVLLKSDNSTLYLSRDLAALIDRYERHQFDKMLYVVDNSQNSHFTSLFEIAKSVDNTFCDKCEHVKFGRIRGMSTRKGTVVFLKDILNEARDKMREKQLKSPNTRKSSMEDETCDILGTSAVIINDLKQKRQHDYTFNWDKVVQTEGDSGIKLQYLHCRLFSIENRSGLTIPDECDPRLLPETVVSELVKELSRFEDVLDRSLAEYEASHLVNYLFRLSNRVNKAVNELRVLNEKEDVARQRLLLFRASRKILRKSLEILGVRPLNEM